MSCSRLRRLQSLISPTSLAADVSGRQTYPADVPGGWTRPADVRAAVRRKWDSGALLARFAAGQDWEPLSIPIRGPSARQIGEHLADVREWAAEWTQAARGPLRVEYKQVGGRHFGTNSIPCRAWLHGYDEAWALLKVRPDVRRLAELIETARGTRLVPWLTGHPMRALRLADQWDRLQATVRWIEERQAPGMYLRQVDVPGVDTKFIERHKGVLTELLDAQLDPSRVKADAPDFAGRYGFLRKPGYVRFRVARGFRGFSEMSVRTSEITAAPDGITRAYVIENEITYLAFPVPAAAMAILGGGYAVPVLEPLGWLADRARSGLLGRHRHPRVRDLEPAAPLLRPRAVHPDGPRHLARAPQPVGDRVAAHGRPPGPARRRRGRALPGSGGGRVRTFGAPGAGTDRLRRPRARPGRRSRLTSRQRVQCWSASTGSAVSRIAGPG